METKHFKKRKESDGLIIDYDLCLPIVDGIEHSEIVEEQSQLNAEIEEFLREYSETEEEILRLTNQADGYDYALSITSGIVAGLIDIIVVGDWDFKSAKGGYANGNPGSNETINRKIIAFAKKNPDYTVFCTRALEGAGTPRRKPLDPNRLDSALAFIEWKFPLPGDNLWKGNADKVSAKSHHIDDFAHHPTLVGLICAILYQFRAEAVYHNRDGVAIHLPIAIDENGLLEGKTPSAKIASGIINWCIDVVKNWRGHLFSDMGGSKATAGGGMGLPGTLMSFLKEMAAVPIFNTPDFNQKLYDAFVHGIGTEKNQVDLGAFNALFEGADSKFDMRTELAVANELKRQTIPVTINEIIVRTFYFVRHLFQEIKDSNSIHDIHWKKTIPFMNRTIVRMITISSGTMEVLDLADAFVQGIKKSGGTKAGFVSQFVLRVNFIGIGRFTLSASTDLLMGIGKGRYELALASADVGKTALATVKIIDESEKVKQKTSAHLDAVTKKVENLAKLIK